MVFSEDGRYVLSSAVGERYVAVWRIDGSKKKSACCVLAMDHPAVFLDSRCIDTQDTDGAGLCVLAISEMGVCYFWYGKNIEELRNSKPTKVSVPTDDRLSKNHKGAAPYILAAKLQGIAKPAAGHVFVAYGLLIKPSFEKIIVQSGTDIQLNNSLDGILLPFKKTQKSKKGSDVQNEGESGTQHAIYFGFEYIFLIMKKYANCYESHISISTLVSHGKEVNRDRETNVYAGQRK